MLIQNENYFVYMHDKHCNVSQGDEEKPLLVVSKLQNLKYFILSQKSYYSFEFSCIYFLLFLEFYFLC